MTHQTLGQLNSKLIGIGELITSRHTVPKNQREYAWEEKNVEDFINDITEAQNQHMAEYFLGTIVLTGSGPRPEVIDGQQRMATTCIFIAAARDYLINTKKRDNITSGQLLSQQYLLYQDPADLEIYPYFELNEIDNGYFRKAIIEEPTKKDLSSFHSEIPSHILLKKAYQLAQDKIKKIAEAPPGKAREQLIDLIKYLRDNVKIIALTAPNEASAFTLFETLNDRGLELATSDLLKNFLLGKSSGRINEVKTNWLAMKTTLESFDAGNSIVMYIRHLWCSEYGLVRDKELYNAIKREITNPSKAVKFSESLFGNARKYAALIHPEQDFWKVYDFNAHKNVKALNLLNLKQPRPLLLSILDQFKPKEVKKSLEMIEAWSFRFSVTKSLGGERMERLYSTLAKDVKEKKIKNAKELKDAIDIVPGDEDFRDSLEKYSVTSSILARYILIELEKTKTNQGKLEYIPNDNPQDVNLEHILPQTYPENGWNAFDEESHKAFAFRLGNLTIMVSDDNSAADQEPFNEKKKYYIKSKIQVTSELGKYSKWTAEQIKERQKELAKLAIKRWSL